MQNKSLIQNLRTGLIWRLSKLFKNQHKDINLGAYKKRYYKHLPPGQIRKHKILGSFVYFTSPQELLHGLDEIFIQEIYKQELRENANVIDCGANIGLSVIYIKNHHPSANIIAFEPDEKNFELLTKNVGSFQLKKVELRKEAVWIEDGFLNFKTEGSMSSKIEPSNNLGVQVKATRLKNLLKNQVDFLKMDIEGAEYEVIKDIRQELVNVQNLFIEYHGNFDQNKELNEILAILNENGFKYYIKEATSVYDHPLLRGKKDLYMYDIQLNIFSFK